MIAEHDGATGAPIREYVWLGDIPVAVIEAGTTPKISYIHPDHLNRPIAMTDDTGAFVNETIWVAFGGIHIMTGSTGLDMRFPGQWYQHEGGLHYNWHRSYDPTIARYTQPDPLGLVDGPSRYAYAASDPLQKVDPTGTIILPLGAIDEIRKWLFPPQSPPGAGGGGICNAPPEDDKCREAYANISSVTSGLKERYSHLIRNELNLPQFGPFSVDGHRQQFRNEQRRLRRLLNEANAKGCTGYSPEAWYWATVETPYPGWGGGK